MKMKEIVDYASIWKESLIITFAVMFFFWLFFSSALDFQHIIVGAVLSLAVTIFSHDLLVQKGEKLPKGKTILFFVIYVIHLAIEIAKANIQVAKIVLSPRIKISPGIVKFKTKLRTDIMKATLANSITLTPGTMTIDIIDDAYYVHAINKEAANGVKDWHMEKRLEELEKMELDSGKRRTIK